MFEFILQEVFFGNSVYEYMVCLVIFLISIIVIKTFKFIFLRNLKKWSKKTETTLDDFAVELIERLAIPFSYLLAFYLSIKTLNIPARPTRVIDVLGMAVVLFFGVRFVVRILGYTFKMYWKKTGRSEALENSLNGILKVLKFVLWSLAVIFFLDNLGFKISAVIAGLGVGGVAIALAAQAILKDLFSYFSIIFDRPFEVGDFIIIGDLLGTVEHVGIKTTRIRSLGGEQLVFSNSDLTDSRVRNYKRMEKRRVVFKLGVIYQTPLEKLKEIPQVIRDIVESIDDTVFDRAHFSSYGDFSLVYEVVYYVLSSDYNKYMDIQQQINFGINQEFKKREIEFAYPTQTLYVEK